MTTRTTVVFCAEAVLDTPSRMASDSNANRVLFNIVANTVAPLSFRAFLCERICRNRARALNSDHNDLTALEGTAALAGRPTCGVANVRDYMLLREGVKDAS